MSYEITTPYDRNVTIIVDANSPEEALKGVLDFIHHNRLSQRDLSNYKVDNSNEESIGSIYTNQFHDFYYVKSQEPDWIDKL